MPVMIPSCRPCLAAGLLLLLSAGPASAVTLYDRGGTHLTLGGELQAAYYSRNADYDGALDSGDASLYAAGVLAIEGRTALGGGSEAYAHADWDMPDGWGHTSFDLKAMYIGVEGEGWGRVQLGTFEDAFYYAQESVDVFDEFAGIGIFDSSEKQGMIMYAWEGGGLAVQLSYQSAKSSQGVEGAYLPRITYSTDDGLGDERGTLDIEYALALGAGYVFADAGGGPLAVRVGVGYTDFGSHRDAGIGYYRNQLAAGSADAASAVRYDRYRQWGASLSWGEPDAGAYAALHYERRLITLCSAAAGAPAGGLELSGSSLAAGYTSPDGLSMYAGLEYVQVEADGARAQALILPLYVLCRLTPHLETWAEARIDLDTDDGGDGDYLALTDHDLTHHIFSVGLRLMF